MVRPFTPGRWMPSMLAVCESVATTSFRGSGNPRIVKRTVGVDHLAINAAVPDDIVARALSSPDLAVRSRGVAELRIELLRRSTDGDLRARRLKLLTDHLRDTAEEGEDSELASLLAALRTESLAVLADDDLLAELQGWGGPAEMSAFEAVMWLAEVDPRLRSTIVSVMELDRVPDWERFKAAVRHGWERVSGRR